MFSQGVKQLCQTLWPAPISMTETLVKHLRKIKILRPLISAPQEALVEHLRGGDLNHIASITIPWVSQKKGRNLILRVPRWGQSRLDREVAILAYVREKSNIPVAIVYATDFTTTNALGKPYVLQYRIPGSDLRSVWKNLSHFQRCAIARELGSFNRTLLSLESPWAGLVDFNSGNIQDDDKFQIVPFEVGDQDHDEPMDESSLQISLEPRRARDSQTPLQVFQSQIERWRSIALAASCGEIDDETKLWDKISMAVQQMHDVGLFKLESNCLCHVDLHPGNIMVQTRTDGSIAITGILDWDEAIVAPKFMATMPPAWLWDDRVFDEHRVDETGVDPWPYELGGANAAPESLQKQELKRVYEESAGFQYLGLAYTEQYRLCRGLFRIAKEGLNDNQFWKAAERILDEWDYLRPSLQQ